MKLIHVVFYVIELTIHSFSSSVSFSSLREMEMSVSNLSEANDLMREYVSFITSLTFCSLN